MEICFVIQPFDCGKFDKRYEDIFVPAIEAAGFEPYRVDKDPSVSIPIEAVADGIRNAAICLADITEDNPNVWYELGFAFASCIPTVMVCSQERKGKYPFDIQHRSIIKYLTESGRDYDQLRQDLTIKLKATEKKDKLFRSITESHLVEPLKGLKPHEIKLLGVLARGCSVVDGSALLNDTRAQAQHVGIDGITFKMAIRNLEQSGYITIDAGYPFVSLKLNSKAWDWIEANTSEFV